MNRQGIIDRLVVELKTISDVGQNVYSEMKTWDDVPDDQFPTLIVQAYTETPTYAGAEMDTDFRVMIYGYVMSQDHRESQLNTLINNVRDKIHADFSTNGLTYDRKITSIVTDAGWLKPVGYMVMEISCSVHDVITTR